jgi:hypothetical protein
MDFMLQFGAVHVPLDMPTFSISGCILAYPAIFVGGKKSFDFQVSEKC